MNYDKIIKNKLTIICGHYGVGKTNVAVNIASIMARHKDYKNTRVSLIDFDIVNPYYRSSDNADEARKYGFELICPLFANSNVDIPGVVPDVLRVFEPSDAAVFDVGGDDSGAFALGGLSSKFIESGYELYCVINKYRPSIADVNDAVQMIKDIELSASLKVTGIINNSNLGEETEPSTIRESFSYADEVCSLSKLPLIATTIDEKMAEAFTADEIDRHNIVSIFNATKRPF